MNCATFSLNREHWCPSKLCSACRHHDECYPLNWRHTGVVVDCDDYEKVMKSRLRCPYRVCNYHESSPGDCSSEELCPIRARQQNKGEGLNGS